MPTNNYILTPDGNFVSESELYHYGVPGMKWGVRKAQKYEAKSRIARESAKEWLAIGSNKAAKLRAKGNEGKAAKVESKYKSYANKDLADSKKYRQKAQTHKNEVAKTKSAIKQYRSKYDAAEKASNAADKQWGEVRKQYESLGKNKVSRMLNAARGKTDAAKKYSKMYDSASKASDLADTKWNEVRESYKKTGRNRIERVLNQREYDRSRKR